MSEGPVPVPPPRRRGSTMVFDVAGGVERIFAESGHAAGRIDRQINGVLRLFGQTHWGGQFRVKWDRMSGLLGVWDSRMNTAGRNRNTRPGTSPGVDYADAAPTWEPE